MKSHFHTNGCAPSLALRKRLKEIRKWPTLESSFLSSTKTPQNIYIYIWIPLGHPAVKWALRHVRLLTKISDPNKRDAKCKTDDRKGI